MKWRPRWSQVVIALGLIAALAIATPGFGIRQSLKRAIKREVARQIHKATGPPGAPGTARAYGRVSEVGEVSRDKNVVGVTNPDTGIWCIQLAGGIDMSTTVAVVGTDSSDNETSTGSSAVESAVEWVSGGTDCPSDQIQVFTYLYDGDGTDNTTDATNQPGDNLLVDNEPFSFVVP